MEKLQELFTDRVNNTLGATKKHFYDKFEVEKNLNRLDILKQFIEWLVDNDKIDLEKLDEKAERKPQYTFTDDDGRLGFKLFEVYEGLLMLLSISDSPIEFLISVLK